MRKENWDSFFLISLEFHQKKYPYCPDVPVLPRSSILLHALKAMFPSHSGEMGLDRDTGEVDWIGDGVLTPSRPVPAGYNRLLRVIVG